MKNRKAFTLVELLVVIGIIALLAGILLPAVNLMRKRAVMTAEKADFQSMATGLEQYKADFGDYPRNVNLPTWNTVPNPAPIFYTLAPSLLGPGPGMTQMVGANLEYGDGNDGPGFRCQISGAVPGTGSISSGSTSLTMTADPTYSPQAQALVANFVTPGGANGSGTPTLVTVDVGQPTQETLGIKLLPGPGLSATTLAPAVYSHINSRCLMTVASGRVWGPYISADTFKVAYVPQFDLNGVMLGGAGAPNPMGGYGQPVLLDRWGQVIQYFPTYGIISNRTNDSVPPTVASPSVTAGPLVGDSQPKSIDGTNGMNAIWDARDGAPFFSNTASSGSGIAWADPVSGVSTAYCQQWINANVSAPGTTTFRPKWALQWMLGDEPTTVSASTPLDNVITGAEKLSYTGPYVLISAGPDGPNRANGGFCNLADPTSGAGNALPINTWQKVFTDSGNIYNFDRQ